MTFLNRADGGYRVTRDPGLRAWTLERLEPRTTTTRPRHQELFSRFSSIGARRAGGEARFDDLLLRAARGIVQCVRNASRTRYCVDAPRFPAPPRAPRSHIQIIIYTYHIYHFGPRPHGHPARATLVRTDRVVTSLVTAHATPGRLTFKSVGHAECPHTITLPHGEFLNMTST